MTFTDAGSTPAVSTVERLNIKQITAVLILGSAVGAATPLAVDTIANLIENTPDALTSPFEADSDEILDTLQTVQENSND